MIQVKRGAKPVYILPNAAHTALLSRNLGDRERRPTRTRIERRLRNRMRHLWPKIISGSRPRRVRTWCRGMRVSLALEQGRAILLQETEHCTCRVIDRGLPGLLLFWLLLLLLLGHAGEDDGEELAEFGLDESVDAGV